MTELTQVRNFLLYNRHPSYPSLYTDSTRSMDDEDWLDDSGPSLQQGHQADPLVDREWEKLSTKYNDVRFLKPGGLWVHLTDPRPATAKGSPTASCQPCKKASTRALSSPCPSHDPSAPCADGPPLF